MALRKLDRMIGRVENWGLSRFVKDNGKVGKMVKGSYKVMKAMKG